ncbi:hypothetical protein GOBAR_DD06303 [Gossypium barbadense]|nr:hypothetical protein GOBAR_DD06303 [Gossypium barbadense]
MALENIVFGWDLSIRAVARRRTVLPSRWLQEVGGDDRNWLGSNGEFRPSNGLMTLPWVVIGDFNEILSSFEKRGGRLKSAHQMTKFRSTLEDCSLYDVGYSGRWFTWERRRFSSSNLRERLDRGVANPWAEYVNKLTDRIFPSVLKLNGAWMMLLRRLFRGGGMVAMVICSRSRFHEQKGHKLDLEKRLAVLVEKDPTDEILSEILEVQLGLNFEADKEEMYWAQRAHLNWIQYGDRNTSFFHRVTMARHNRNRIHGLEDDSGQWVTGTEKMLRIAMKYFENLFTASDVEGDDRVLGLARRIITIPVVGRGSSDLQV